jgi:hypothetical protein
MYCVLYLGEIQYNAENDKPHNIVESGYEWIIINRSVYTWFLLLVLSVISMVARISGSLIAETKNVWRLPLSSIDFVLSLSIIVLTFFENGRYNN